MTSIANFAGTGANDASVGTVAWLNPSNITSDDGSSAIVDTDTALSNYLKATNFSFTVPSMATIDGIEVIFGDRGSVNVGLVDSAIRIVKGGVIGSTNNSQGAAWPDASSLETVTIGSSTDLWGETWTPADINSSSFGVVIALQGNVNPSDAIIDYIRIRVYYSLPPGVEAAFASTLEVDKVFPDKFSGSFSAPGTSLPTSTPRITTTTISNPIGEDVLAVMQFSTDGSTWYDAGSMKYNAGGTLDRNFSATCYTTNSSVVIVAGNYSGSSQTCNYKLLLVSDD